MTKSQMRKKEFGGNQFKRTVCSLNNRAFPFIEQAE